MTCSHSFFRNAGVKVQPGGGGRLRPAGAQHPFVGDDGSAAGLLDDAVGQPVDVEHLDLAAHVGVADQQVKLGAAGLRPGCR